MKKIIMAVVLAGLSGGVYAADFSSLHNLRAADVKVSQINLPAPEAIALPQPHGIVPAQSVKDCGPACSSYLAPYDALKELFNTGVQAKPEHMLGWHAGRMLTSHKKDQFHATLLILNTESGPDGGPLFAETPKKLRLTIQSSTNPTEYDILTPEKIAEVTKNRKNLLELEMQFFTSQATDNPNGFDSMTLIYSFRMAGEYLVSKASLYDKSGKEVNTTYSYYFKNVTPV